MASNNINDFCRFCMKNMKISGVLANCTNLFDTNKKPLSILDRLMHVGLVITKKPGKSKRVCKVCVTTLSVLEKHLPVYWRWVENEKDKETCALLTATNSEKRNRETTPSKTPRALKRFCHKLSSPGRQNVRRSITATFAKQKLCDTEEAKISEHINNRKWKAAAKLIMDHKHLAQEVKEIILSLVENECQTVCNPNNKFILWKSSSEDLMSFSFDKLESDLKRLSPFLFSSFATICQNSSPVICAASAIALRGREPRLSAFAHYLNCVLLYGGAKKAVFDRLSKLAITTAHKNAIGKQKELANKCGDSLFLLKRENESFLNLEAERHRNVGHREDMPTSPTSESELIPTDIFLGAEELLLSEELECSDQKMATEVENVMIRSALQPLSQLTTPKTYSIIIDNLDFFMHAHHQSTLHSNGSIHWIHHIAVQDRIPTHHLASDRPLLDLHQYNLTMSLPGLETQTYMRREFIVLGSRILTQYLAVFRSFHNVVVHHIPHQYSEEMTQPSTDYPLGLIFKNENKTSDLSEVLQHIQHKYAPKGPDGVSKVLVGGDRLTEANCRNIQRSFADGNTSEERLEGMVFKFEDWHAIRVLFEIHFKVFFSVKSGKDHGTLCANMTKLRCSNAKQGPHAAYNAYKHFFTTDITALFIAAAIEVFGLKDVDEIPESFVPEEIASASHEVRRAWLHEKTSEVVDKCIMLGNEPQAVAGVSESPLTSTQKKHYPCRAPGCHQSYTYLKSRDNHELKKHHMEISSTTLQEHPTPSNRDHKQEHTLARLSFGFFLLDMLDAVKEGDGERLMRLYRVALLYYKAYGHSHYAYSTFLLTLQVNASLTPQMAHSVTWNRFWSSRGGKGCNIPLDLHLEHVNNFLKSFLKGLGPNLSEEAARRVSQSIGVLREMMDKVDGELGLKSPTGNHRAGQHENDVLTLVDVFKEGQLFSEIHGRQFQAFPGFDKNLLCKIKPKDLWQWMNGKMKECRNLQI